MSPAPEPGPLGPQITLFDHALRLHRENPDSPLVRDGYPYPDEEQHRRREPQVSRGEQRRAGIEVATILDEHFNRQSPSPRDLANQFHDVYVPIHPNDQITAAACRADAQQVRRTGHWLVRHATDRCAATVGLALLATVWDEADIPLIQTIGLLSDRFGPLAARALQRRRGGAEALLWLAERIAGWGRVYVVESLCTIGSAAERPWLLRRACDGDLLNGYFAGKVATAMHLHEAIIAANADSELVDHTGRLLTIMADCEGMGMTLGHYPPAAIVLEAYVKHVGRLEPTVERYFVAAQLADYLHQEEARRLSWPPDRRERILSEYLSLLDRKTWCEAARAAWTTGDARITWLADTVAPRLRLRAFNEHGMRS